MEYESKLKKRKKMKRGMDEKEKGGREGREKRRRWINQEIRQNWKKRKE